MRFRFISISTAFFFTFASCKSRPFNDGDVKNSRKEKNDLEMDIDPMYFNAFNFWANWYQIQPAPYSDSDNYEDASREPVTEYPKGYEHHKGNFVYVDSYFYVDKRMWRDHGDFQGTPTQEATVEGNVLIYPKTRRPDSWLKAEYFSLRLKFSKASDKAMNHDEAVNYCKKVGRLPTSRELFDFCTVGINPEDVCYGLNPPRTGKFCHKKGSYAAYQKGRCNDQNLWSLSVENNTREDAFRFDSNDGDLDIKNRDEKFLVRCILK